MVSSFASSDLYSENVIKFFRAYSRKNVYKCLESLSDVDTLSAFSRGLLTFLRQGIYNREPFAQSRVSACGLRPSVDLLEACLPTDLGELEVSLLRCVADRCVDAPPEVEQGYYKDTRAEKEAVQLSKGAELVGNQSETVIPLSTALGSLLTSRPLVASIES